MRMRSTGQRELKLCDEYEKQHCQDVTHALVLDISIETLLVLYNDDGKTPSCLD